MAVCAPHRIGTHLITIGGSSFSQLQASKLELRASGLQWDLFRVARYRFWQRDLVQSACLVRSSPLSLAPSCCMGNVPNAYRATFRRVHVRSSHASDAEEAEKVMTVERQPWNLLQRAARAAATCFDVVKRPAVVALILSLLLTQVPAAWAASGGVMGGRAFSSGGRSGGSAGRVFSAPQSSFSYSAPYVAPSPSFSYSAPYVVPSPSLSVTPVSGFWIGVGSSFLVLLLGFLAFFFISGFLTDRTQSNLFPSTSKTSVLKLQVGLLGMARALQQDLDRIAEKADTSSPNGLHHILTETVLALLRHPDYCISGYSSADVKRDSEAGEKLFNELSLEERAKFDEETIVNVDSIFRRRPSKAKSRFNNEYIVVTVLVATEGDIKLPAISSNATLKEALRKLGSIPKDQTLAVEVLWTPQDQNDTLSERELLRDYPLLRSL